MNLNTSNKHFLLAILCFVLTIAVCGFYMKGLMFSPNQHASTFGGDGLTIHYNLQYHASYGDGVHLDSQYYPHGETIFMTDAQGLLACTLAKLRPYFPWLPAYSVGISNFLIYWSNGLAAMLIFFCLLKLNVDPRLSVVFAVLITCLSPQIYRQTCGHYALGYAFTLPAVFYFLLHNEMNWSYAIKAVLLFFMLVVLGLNNPYLLAISCSMLLACSGIGLLAYLLKFRINLKMVFSWFAVALLALLVTEGILNSLDEVSDRVKVPYGFFKNVASYKGLLFPDKTWVSEVLTDLFDAKRNKSEDRSYIGFIPLMVLVILPFLLLIKRKFVIDLFRANNLAVIFLGSIAVLVFAFGEPFNQMKEWSLEHLGKVLQFRAPARFTWVFYYSISFVSVVLISKVFAHFKEKNKKGIIVMAFIPILVFWSIDVNQFLHWRTKKKILHNAFSPEKLKPFHEISNDLSLDSVNYHGIFLLPTEHGWTDKVLHKGSWRSNYNGYQLSMASGLPLINGKLSRASLSNTLNSMQLISNPLIKRNLLDLLSKDKSILLLKAIDEKLSQGEVSLMEFSDTIYSNNDIVLAKVDLENLSKELKYLRATAFAYSKPSSKAILYDHYEESTAHAYVGKGCRLIKPGKQTFLKYELSPEYANDALNVSFWYYADPTISGGPSWTLKGMKEDKVETKSKIWALSLMDTQNGWLRVAFNLPIGKEFTELTLTSEFKHNSYIDELLIKRVNDTICHKVNESFYYNNILIE